MAMLAGPRERKRYNLVPRGKALYEDDTRFGTKMLEKMGWTKGKGLGANENGAQDFVRVRYKNDAQGLGFEDRDDQWTQHEESFTGLLQTLNNDGKKTRGEGDDANDDGGNASAGEGAELTTGFGFSKKSTKKLKEKFSGESLEAKSKQSKARVHYKKFTRGKDLSQYSEKDLANIFGRKGTEAEDQQSNALYQQFATFATDQPKAEEGERDTDQLTGVQMISSALSVSDYFKQKMEAMKNKLKNTTFMRAGEDKEQTALVGEDTEAIQETEIKEKKKKRKRESQNETIEEQKTDTGNLDEPKRKKKKNKVVKEELTSLIERAADIEEDSRKESKKKKDKKVELVEKVVPIDATVISGLDANAPKKKKNKSKRKNQEEEQESLVETVEIANDADNFESKKSKKHKIKESAEPNLTMNDEMEDESSTLLNKKSKTNKETNQTVSANNISNSDSLDKLVAQLNLYSAYTISSFSAEKFRNIELDSFSDSNMGAINGYAFSEDLQLRIQNIPGDASRIMQLWDRKYNKYKYAQPKIVFNKYAQKVKQARSHKTKLPRFQLKTWKRKHAFQIL